jgi:hypothetical protein
LKTLGKLSRRSATTRFAEAPLLPDEDDALVLHGRCTHHIAALHMVRGTMATRRGLSDPIFPPIDLWLLRGLLLVGDPISWRTLCKKLRAAGGSTAETAAGHFSNNSSPARS